MGGTEAGTGQEAGAAALPFLAPTVPWLFRQGDKALLGLCSEVFFLLPLVLDPPPVPRAPTLASADPRYPPAPGHQWETVFFISFISKVTANFFFLNLGNNVLMQVC